MVSNFLSRMQFLSQRASFSGTPWGAQGLINGAEQSMAATVVILHTRIFDRCAIRLRNAARR
jgi:hypothetical protein